MSVPRVPLSDAVEDVSAGNSKVPSSQFEPSGQLAVVDQGRELIAGYTHDTGARVRVASPVIVFGDHTRAVKYVDFPFAMGADGTKVLQVRDGFDTRFVYEYLRSTPIPNAGYSRHFKFLKRLEIPKPPLIEQQRIAAILFRADMLRLKRQKVTVYLDLLVFETFHSMFGSPDDALSSIPLRDVATLSGGRNLVADDKRALSDFRVLKISAVTSGVFKASESKPLPSGYTPPSEHLVRVGDLLMSRANTAALVGAVAYVDDVPDGVALPDKVWRFEWRDTRSSPIFYRSLLQTPAIRSRISRMASGTGGAMKNVSKVKLESMLLPAVSFEDQLAFADAVSKIDAHRVKALRGVALHDELLASLQRRAFQGQL